MPHRHPANIAHYDKADRGDRAADWLVSKFGSWAFIIWQNACVVLWAVGNAWLIPRLGDHPFDKYPFIMLNLVFSWQAANFAPVVLMAQNRQAEKDRITTEHDFAVNERALRAIERIAQHHGIDLED